MMGDVRARVSINSELKAKAALIGDVEVGRIVIKRDETDEYEGMYIVTPSADIQTLETANKKLLNNVEIKAIPYHDVSNEYGRTIYIGGEI